MKPASNVSENVVFLFPAHGSEHTGMCHDLYAHFPRFRERFDYCAEYLLDHMDTDLRQLIAPPRGQEQRIREKINQTYVVQPALFALEYSLSCFLNELGITPACMLGYSVGEFTAACLAGVFSLQDGLKLVAERGRLVQSMPAGSMLAVGLSEDKCRALENEHVSLATVLEENHCVLSGVPEVIAALHTRLRAQQVATKELTVSHAFHSVMMDPVIRPFKQAVSEVSLMLPKSPFVSCVTGNHAGKEVLTADYWANHLRNTIRWKDAIDTLAQDPNKLFVEVGPNNLMASLVRRHASLKDSQRVFSICNPETSRQSGIQHFLQVLGLLNDAGITVSWQALGSDDTPILPSVQKPVTHAHQPSEVQDNAANDELHDLFEEAVCELFARTLKLSCVKADDNFLDLGGNSLMAMQLIAIMRNNFNIEIPIKDFFGAATPRGTMHLLVKALQDSNDGDAWTYAITPASKIDNNDVSKKQNTPPAVSQAHTETTGKHLKFSLFFFSGAEDDIVDAKYDLVLKAARYADEHGFHALWTPERHFNKFGGLYASPSVLGAALASITKRIGIRAGSVISPLGQPFRIAEEWSMVDNLSNGRAGVAFGSGFQPRDFILAPDNFEQRKQIMLDNLVWCNE